MKVVVDMNLSPDWCKVLRQDGWEAIHWSEIGKPTAPWRDSVAGRSRSDGGSSRAQARARSGGTVVEELPPDAFEVELCDDRGRAYASVGIPREKLIVLRYQSVEAA